MYATAQENIVELNTRSTTHKLPQRRASQNGLLAATRQEILRSGWRRFNLAAVLDQAQATEQDMETWWGSEGAMIVAAVTELIHPPVVEAQIYDLERFCRLVDPIVEFAGTNDGAALMRACLLAAGDDPQASAAFREYFKKTFKSAVRQALAQSSAQKLISSNYDVDDSCELLYGPLWHRLVTLRAPLRGNCTLRAVAGLLNTLQRG